MVKISGFFFFFSFFFFLYLIKLTRSSAIKLIFPTALEMASNIDFPGPTYCHKITSGVDKGVAEKIYSEI
jgi:hypothetical protein